MPLYFKEADLVRVAKAGEEFTVLLVARPVPTASRAPNRVYISSRDAQGKGTALSLALDAFA